MPMPMPVAPGFDFGLLFHRLLLFELVLPLLPGIFIFLGRGFYLRFGFWFRLGLRRLRSRVLTTTAWRRDNWRRTWQGHSYRRCVIPVIAFPKHTLGIRDHAQDVVPTGQTRHVQPLAIEALVIDVLPTRRNALMFAIILA